MGAASNLEEKKATSNLKTEKNSNNVQMKPEPYKKIWQKLFHAQRGGACKSDKIAAKLKAKLAAAGKSQGQKGKKGKFAWVKEWGYGSTAYFLDYLDSVLMKEVLGEFKKIYKDMFAMKSKDTPKYKDALDMKKLIGKTKNKKLAKKLAANLKKSTKITNQKSTKKKKKK